MLSTREKIYTIIFRTFTRPGKIFDIVLLILIVLSVGVVVLSFPLYAQPGAGVSKPNILLIFIDNMGWPAVSCLGDEHVKTNNILFQGL
jgi:hypothetical protein